MNVIKDPIVQCTCVHVCGEVGCPVHAGQLRELAESTRYIAGHAVGDELRRQLKQQIGRALLDHVQLVAVRLSDRPRFVDEVEPHQHLVLDERAGIVELSQCLDDGCDDSAVLLETTGDDF